MIQDFQALVAKVGKQYRNIIYRQQMRAAKTMASLPSPFYVFYVPVVLCGLSLYLILLAAMMF